MNAMSSLSDKLKSLGVQIGAENLPRPENNRRETTSELENMYPGCWRETSSGPVFVLERSYPALYRQGAVSICPEHPLEVIGKWAGADLLDKIPLEKFVFIDTETTGLSGGTGTYTFLIGAGKFTKDEFKIKQFFMNDPAEESAQLAALENYLAPARVVVSYNGKAFDLPRLRTRYKSHGWPPPLTEAIHIDLLHLMRRLFSASLPNCSLGTIEYDLLEFERASQDIPGWQVAERYFQYLQTGEPAMLKGIFYHNEMDVLSMPAVLNLAASSLDRPLQDSPRPNHDLVSIARFYHALEDLGRAEIIYQQAIHSEQSGSPRELAGIRELSFLYKRKGLLDQAVSLWKQAAEQGELYAHVELAKAFEHSYTQLSEAVHWTLSAIDLHQNGKAPPPHPENLAELRHRLSRLKRKLKRNSIQTEEE